MVMHSHGPHVKQLISKIVTLKSNPHYRMADVVYRKGFRYRDSTQAILAASEFEGTILKRYLLDNPDIESPNIPLLSRIVGRTVASRKLHLPQHDELVVHIRAGDVVEHDWFLKTNFAEQIEKYSTARICSIVICFAFQEFIEKGWWLFSNEKLQKNVAMLEALLVNLLSQFPEIRFDVVSHREIDADFIYMVMAPHFIRDQGGFSDLICDVREYRAITARRSL